MSSEKEFKDELKNKLSSKEFTFDEANWEQARQMIDASREEKKRGILPFILFGLLFIGSGILGVYFINQPETSEKELAIRSNNMTVDANNAQPSVTETENKKNSTEVKTEIKVETKNAESVTEKKQPKIDEPINKEIKETTQAIKNNNKTERKINNIKKEKHEDAVITSAAISKTKVTKEKRETPKEKNETTVVNLKKKTDTEQDPKRKTKTVKEENPTEVAAIIPATNNSNDPAKDPVTETRGTTNTVTEASIVKTPSVETKAEITAVVDSSAKPVAAENFTRMPVHFISFEAGTNYLFGWNNPGKKDADGFNPVIGLNYSNIITKGITFSFGVHYTMVHNLSYSSHTVKTTRYTFGEESDIMVFTPTTLHYVVAPIRLSYDINPKNVIGLGCNVGYLFNVNSNVELYSQRSSQKSNPTVLKTSGYTQGFKTFDTQLSLFYRRGINKDLCLHTEFMYGLTDIKDNTFFNSNVKEKNVGVKFTLIYNLFKK